MMHFEDRERALFGFLIEEMSEVTKAISKADRFGWGSHKPGTAINNLASLQSEIGDVFAMIALIHEVYGFFPYETIMEQVPIKLRKLQKYHPDIMEGIDISNIIGEI